MSTMTEISAQTPRDDRAWPRWAVPASLAVGTLSLAAALVITAQQGWPLSAPAMLLADILAGGSLMLITVTRWLHGASIPAGIGFVSACLAVAAILAGVQALLGLVSALT
jgi:hypothetical protein